MSRPKRTSEEVDVLLRTKNVKRVSTFVDSHKPITLLCKKHNHTWQATIANVSRYVYACPMCRLEHQVELGKKTGGRLLYTSEQIDKKLKAAKIERDSPFIGMGEKLTVTHTCGYSWTQRAYDLVARLYCPSCAKGFSRLTPEAYSAKVLKLHPSISLKSEFKGLNHEVDFYCRVHKRQFTTQSRNLIRGGGCPLCSKTNKLVDDESGSRLLKGREPQALAWLKANTSLKAKDIQTSNLPVIRYTFLGRQRRYLPGHAGG